MAQWSAWEFHAHPDRMSVAVGVAQGFQVAARAAEEMLVAALDVGVAEFHYHLPFRKHVREVPDGA